MSITVIEKKADIKRMLRDHAQWLKDPNKGRRAILRGTALMGADLREADLRRAIFKGANLSDTNFDGADLREVDFARAGLSGASMQRADLRGARLDGAAVAGLDLTRADLRGASFIDAEYLDIARLAGAKLSQRLVPEKGSFIAWKQARDVVIKLRIPASAKRVAALISNKCRASSAYIVAIYNLGSGKKSRRKQAYSIHDPWFTYRVGKTVRPERAFDPRPERECTSGIHFFLTREEAENY